MNAADAGSPASPANAGGRRVLSLEQAKDVARRDPAGWCAMILGDTYLVGKATAAAAGKECCHLVDENNEPLRFATFAEAAQFLHAQLGVLRVVKLV